MADRTVQKPKEIIKVGDTYPVWWTGDKGSMATVLGISPYRGRYTEMFTHVLKLAAPRTRRGSLEMAVKL